MKKIALILAALVLALFVGRAVIRGMADEETKIRFTLSGGESLDAERSQLLEELSRELGEQL